MKFIYTDDISVIDELRKKGFACVGKQEDGTHIFLNDENKIMNFSREGKFVLSNILNV